MSHTLKQNIIANYLGHGWNAIMALAFIPLYLHFLGIEGYGLLGIFATLSSLSGLLDLGLTPTITRELARLNAKKTGDCRQLVRTLEVIYWAMAVVIGMGIIVMTPLLAQHWVQAERLSASTIKQAFFIMGLSIACQWPLSFYSGGLEGLQRQVLLNAINITATTLRGVGAVLLLWLVSPTIQALLIWQAAIGTLQTLVVGWWLWRFLPGRSCTARFNRQVLRNVWQFAAGMSGIGVTALILFNMDKIILSKLLTLEKFGYYSLAATAAASLYRLIYPIVIACFPRFTQLVALSDQAGLIDLYHCSCQTMSVLILPITLIMVFFSRELLLLWTHNPITAEHTYFLLRILVIGTALSGLMHLPEALQKAYGWTKLIFYTNIAAMVLLVPSIILITRHYGAVGAAFAWTMHNCAYVVITMHIMHLRLLQGEKWRWYARDVFLPLGGSLAVVFLGHWFIPQHLNPMVLVLYLMTLWLIATSVSSLVAPQFRVQLATYFPFGRQNEWKTKETA